MDLKISVFKSPQALLDNKTCFNETVKNVPTDFGYANLIMALKGVFGEFSVIQFCII